MTDFNGLKITGFVITFTAYGRVIIYIIFFSLIVNPVSDIDFGFILSYTAHIF
jgi:hypothetical protein